MPIDNRLLLTIHIGEGVPTLEQEDSTLRQRNILKEPFELPSLQEIEEMERQRLQAIKL